MAGHRANSFDVPLLLVLAGGAASLVLLHALSLKLLIFGLSETFNEIRLEESF